MLFSKNILLNLGGKKNEKKKKKEKKLRKI
jgi:hypothetical protein